MSEGQEKEQEEFEYPNGKKFEVGYAPSNRMKCKNPKCLFKVDSDPKSLLIEKGSIRLGRRFKSPFSEGDHAVNWCHLPCYFDQETRARKSSKRLEDAEEEVDGFSELTKEDRLTLEGLVKKELDYLEIAKEIKGYVNQAAPAASSNSRKMSKTPRSAPGGSGPQRDIKKSKKEKEEKLSGRRKSGMTRGRDVNRVLML